MRADRWGSRVSPARSTWCWETDTSAPEAGPLGILGGSFDPIHHGHLRLAEEAAERLGLARVLLIPARPWQRSTVANDAQRLEMLRLACAGNRRFAAEALELERAGPSYTVETLRVVRGRYPADTPIWLILGADAFLGVPTWREWEALPALCHVAVIPRPGVALDPPPPLASAWVRGSGTPVRSAAGEMRLLETPQLEISATAIRAIRAAGRSPRYLLPDPVLDYIESADLYRQEGHGA